MQRLATTVLCTVLSNWSRCASVALLLVSVATVQTAHADEWDDFEQARSSYLAQDYAVAAQKLEALIGGEPTALDNEPLLLESRKYLGASYLFLGRREDAEAEFTRVLRQDASYQIDPTQFPQAVLEAFTSARVHVERELREQRERDEREAHAQRERDLRLLLETEQRLRALEALAGREVVRTQNSRWLAALPFGVGQFRNGNRRLGKALAATESLCLAFGIVTYFGNMALPDWDPLNPPRTRLSDRAFSTLADFTRITNYVSFASFLGLALTGIIEAQVHFVPYRETTRRRRLPEAGAGGRETSRIDLELGLGPLGGSLRLRF